VSPRGSGGPQAFPAVSGRLELPQVREVALQLVKALLLLSQHDIIHADIKPENVLIVADGNPITSSLNVRLTDFGNAIKSREVVLYSQDFQIQTMAYRAPEVLLGGCGKEGSFDHKIDMWSLGVLLVELYLGRPLFRASSPLLMIKRIMGVLGEFCCSKHGLTLTISICMSSVLLMLGNFTVNHQALFLFTSIRLANTTVRYLVTTIG